MIYLLIANRSTTSLDNDQLFLILSFAVVSSDLKRLNLFANNSATTGKSLSESQYLEQESRPTGSAKSNNSVPPDTPNVGGIKPIAITLK